MPRTRISSTLAFASSLVSPVPPSEPRHLSPGRHRLIWRLFLLGAVLEMLYLILFVLQVQLPISTDALLRVWERHFLWLAPLHVVVNWLERPLLHITWANPLYTTGNADAFLLACGLALLVTVLAGRSDKARYRRLTSGTPSAGLFWVVVGWSSVFVVTMVLAPLRLHMDTQDVLLSWFYGRMVVIYHINPYTISSTINGNVSAVLATNISHDPVRQLLLTLSAGDSDAVLRPVASIGPVWMDVSILVSLAAHNSIFGALLGFKLLSALFFLVSVALMWAILGHVQPGMRLFATLFYAWGPLSLLAGVAQVHPESLVVFLLLLALFFLLRESLVLSWFFVLLAVLVHLSCLLLLPLILCISLRKLRFMHTFWRLLWLLGLLALSGLAVVLAYLPYWQDWGMMGIATSIQSVFWQHMALNSLDAAMLNLPQPLALLAWLVVPQHWMLLVLLVLGCLLLFTCWLLDTPAFLIGSCAWTMLLLVTLQPLYWPWFLLVPLALGLCMGDGRIQILLILLAAGALLSMYLWHWQPVWTGQGLVTIGAPLLIWGWIIFLDSTWHLSGAADVMVVSRPPSPRPPWLSRPSWPSRPRVRRSDF